MRLTCLTALHCGYWRQFLTPLPPSPGWKTLRSSPKIEEMDGGAWKGAAGMLTHALLPAAVGPREEAWEDTQSQREEELGAALEESGEWPGPWVTSIPNPTLSRNDTSLLRPRPHIQGRGCPEPPQDTLPQKAQRNPALFSKSDQIRPQPASSSPACANWSLKCLNQNKPRLLTNPPRLFFVKAGA